MHPMNHSEFAIGETFWCGNRQWRCTDKGTRVIVAICLDDNTVRSVIVRAGKILDGLERQTTLSRAESEAQGWFKGPPYAVAETVFDENDIGGCTKEPE